MKFVLALVVVGSLGLGGWYYWRSHQNAQLKERVFVTKPIVRQGGKVIFEVEFMVEPARCFFGDIDYMNFRGQLAKQTQVIMAVEPLLPQGQVQTLGHHEDISLVTLNKGFKRSFAIRDPGRDYALYALTICQDSDNKKACFGKRLSDIDKYFSWHLHDREKAFHSAKQDVIYYLQPMLLTPEGLAFLGETRGENRQRFYHDFARFLVQQIGWSSATVTKLLGDLAKTIESVGSVPAQIAENLITLGLPKLDTVNCELDLVQKMY